MVTTEEERFASLYRSYHRLVYAYCRRRTSVEHAEDALAETFLTAWRKIGEVPQGDAALLWLYTVAFRVMGHQWRSAGRRKRLHERLVSAGGTYVEPPEDYIVTRHESQQILRALSRLKSTDQEILRLALWEELSHREIAQVLDLTTDATKKRFSRARKSLAREYNRIEKSSASPAAQEGGAW